MKMPVRKQQCLFTVLLLNVFNHFASTTFFHIGVTEKKCFFEEVPEESTLIGNYLTQLYEKQRDEYLPANQNLRIFVEAKDPGGKEVLYKQHSSNGRFSFTSHKTGRYQICLQSSSLQRPLSAGSILRVHLDILVGKHTKNDTVINDTAKDKVTELQLRVRQLTEQLQQIHREQDYQRLREKHFLEVDHSTNMWIFWWPVVRSLYVVAVVMWITNSW